MVFRKITITEGLKPLIIEYSDNNTYYGDTDVYIYDDYKLSMVLTDGCGAVVGSKVFSSKRGDLMIFRPSEVHFGRFDRKAQYHFITFIIPTDLFHHVFVGSEELFSPFLDTSRNRVNRISLSSEYRHKCLAIADEILPILKANNAADDVIIFSKLVEVLDMCRKHYVQQKNDPHIESIPLVVTNALQIIDDSFPEFIGLPNIAELTGCSITYLTQTFKKFTGKSIYEYVTERRLEHARRLLEQGESVTNACYLSGSCDCSNFIVAFKNHFHMTPGKYKNKRSTQYDD